MINDIRKRAREKAEADAARMGITDPERIRDFEFREWIRMRGSR